jgi:hypothetical protein
VKNHFISSTFTIFQKKLVFTFFIDAKLKLQK